MQPDSGSLSDPLMLEPASPEAKRYQRQRLWSGLASVRVTLLVLAFFARWAAPWLDWWLAGWLRENRWLRLIAWGFLIAATLEVLTLPFAFWSGFVLEKRNDLSTQTLGGWVWKQIK